MSSFISGLGASRLRLPDLRPSDLPLCAGGTLEAVTWPAAELLTTGDLRLEPLRVEHAEEMVAVLAPESLYRFTGGGAPNVARLRARYRSQTRGQSSDGSQGWLNWIVRCEPPGVAVGYVQATLEHQRGRRDRPDADILVASLGWVITPSAQGHGIATRTCAEVIDWLSAQHVSRFQALIHPENTPSVRVAQKLGFEPTGAAVADEIRWVRLTPSNDLPRIPVLT